MSGVKGRSGRHGNWREEKRIAIIEKAWEIVQQALEDPTVAFDKKLEIAIKVCVKNIPTEVSGSLEGSETRIIVVNPSEKVNERRAADPSFPTELSV